MGVQGSRGCVIDLTSVEEFWSQLKSVETALNYKNRKRYKRELPKRLRELRGFFKNLMKEIQEKCDEGLTGNLENFQELMEKVFDDDLSSKERVSAIKNIKDRRLDIDLKEILEKGPDIDEKTKDLENILGDNFSTEIKDLGLVYGRSGLCSAFLLRRILEKALFHSFAENNKLDKIESDIDNKKYVGLSKMLNIARNEKNDENRDFINHQTAEKVEDVKFLGDMASHNFLSPIEMDEVEDEFPKIRRALRELSRNF